MRRRMQRGLMLGDVARTRPAVIRRAFAFRGVPRGEDAFGYAGAALAPGSRVKPDQLDRFRRSAVRPVGTLEVAVGGNWRFPRLAGPQKIKRSCGRPI